MTDFAERFEDLRIWQQTRQLTNTVYENLADCRDYAFRDQMQRAAVSIMNNIAEGFERRTSKDFGHFLDIAKGSCGEVRSMLYLAEDRKSDIANKMRAQAVGLSSGIAAFRRRL